MPATLAYELVAAKSGYLPATAPGGKALEAAATWLREEAATTPRNLGEQQSCSYAAFRAV